MRDLNLLSLPELFRELTADGSLDRLIAAAVQEDLHAVGDITSASILPSRQAATAVIRARQTGVLAGVQAILPIVRGFGATESKIASVDDGAAFQAGDVVATITCELRPLLAAERTILNLLGRLCGIATLTRRYVDAAQGTRAAICDTRKTTPGLRALEKHAVRCGGGTLHRIGLFDAALYKDNHLAGIALHDLAARLSTAIRSLRSKHAVRFVEVEVDTLEQLQVILELETNLIDYILLDNMSIEQLRTAVSMRDDLAPQMQLEASGGVTLQRVAAIAATGVDRISVGGLTHSAVSLDLGLDID